MKYYLGIDLGGTGIKTGIVNEKFEIIGRGSVATQLPRSADLIMDDIAIACGLAAEDAGITLAEVSQAGIGTPGTVNEKDGILEFAGNLDMHKYPMRDALQQRLGLNCTLHMENDANAAAVGELMAGAAKGRNNAICITLGTGVGSGIIIDGRVFSGTNYAGGEIGHTVIKVGGEYCTCGRHGCWEAYASATALINQTKASMKKHPESAMWQIAGDIDSVNGKTPFDAKDMGDKAGTAVVRQYIKYVACGVTNVINVFQPDIICIGGGVCRQGENLLGPMRKLIEKERFSKYSDKQTEIVTAKLGNDAGIIGAAYLFKVNK